MGQDPGAIRQDIEQTRERMGETVEALGYKADVPGRAKEAISDRVDAMKGKVSGVGSTISDATPDSGDVKQGARRTVGVAQENPLGLAIGALAVGFVGGLLIPSTRVEDEKLGPMADQVKEKARETARMRWSAARKSRSRQPKAPRKRRRKPVASTPRVSRTVPSRRRRTRASRPVRPSDENVRAGAHAPARAIPRTHRSKQRQVDTGA